jgi:hypothetical protein
MKTENFIETDDGITEVTFDGLQVELLDRCDHSAFYKCTGFDSLGRQYEASIEHCCDEYGDITDIERVSYMHHNRKPYQARTLLKSIRYWQSVVNGAVSPKRPIAYYKNKLSYYTKIDIDYLEKITV